MTSILKNSCFVALTLILTFGFVSKSQAALIAHWTGENTAIDATGNGHDGTLVNGTTYDTGVIGQAFKFNEVNDYITVSGDAALQPATISVAMWFKAGSSFADQLLVDSSHGIGNAGWAIQLFGTFRVASQVNRIDFAYGNGAGFPHVQSNAIVADDTWHHVLATLDGSDMRIYVDGALDNTVSYTGTPVASTNNGGNIRLGGHYSFNRQLSGLLDDIRIYDNAVTSVPEPSSLLLASLAGLLFVSRRRWI
jgi:hypothetical protein